MIRLLPISDNPNAGDFAKTIIEQVAAACGLTFEQLNGSRKYHSGGVVKVPFDPFVFRQPLPVHPDMQALHDRGKIIVDKLYSEYCRSRERAAALYFLGYDPQMLLEYKP